MSEPTPIISPIPTPASATLAPPNQTRSSSSLSNNSNSSRGRRSPSSTISRSNSRSSRNSDNPDRKKQSGTTTTISGGVNLGVPNTAQPSVQEQPRSKAGNRGGNKSPKPLNEPGKKEGQNGKSEKPKGNNRRASSNQKGRPNPINTAPPRPTSQNGSGKPLSAPDEKTRSAPIPNQLHAATSTPRTALEAAAEVAKQRENGSLSAKESDPADGALANLQKMISSLKAVSKPSSSNSGSNPGSRSASGAKDHDKAVKSEPAASTPWTIPGSATSNMGKKLKADAPSFTPSFQAVSPVASQAPISPSDGVSPLWQQQPSRSLSHGSAGNRRPSASSIHGGNSSQSLHAFSTVPNLNQGLSVFPNTIPGYGGYPNQLHVHPEAENEDLSPMAFSPHAEVTLQHQQLLAAQALQYQQIQLLQAQLQFAHQQQQQQQAHQSSTSFVAPRFQALAAQRAAQQQQQAANQLLQAQQAFQAQQEQLFELQQQKDTAAAIAEATLRNPPPVFEEDSPEPRHASLSASGRPQLAPTFTFGAKRPNAEIPVSDRSSLSPPSVPPVINRSEGIGGAQATGLAGLAARAHKRTGSELTPAMQAQLELQEQIEALQAKQRALMEDEVSKVGGTSLSQLAKMTPSQTVARHRRVQSSLPSAHTPGESFGGLLAELPSSSEAPRPKASTEMPPPPVPTNVGHGRRHSVNVFNKTAGTGSGFGSISSDIPENGLPSNNVGHHRSGSRSGFESGSWRTSGQMSQGGPAQVADLAAAQAQLQSLAQFRAAAGGGHSKMASFSFPNMLPNLLAATTLSTPIGQTLWQQQQAFQMQLQQTTSGPQRKSLFAPYLPQASLPPLLSAGKLVVGILRVNKKNRSDAYVATDVLEADIYICGSKDRNRALEGDIVAVELLDVDEVWNTKKDKEEKKRKKEENAAYDLKPATAKKLEKKKDDVEVEGQGLTLFEDEEVNDDTKPAYAGHVVAVVERMPGQLFSGQLGVLRPSSAATKEKQEIERREREGDRPKRDDSAHERPKIVWFKPTDKRVPLIAIPTEQAPADFIDNPDVHADKLFVATIKRWPITSLHPFGTLVEELGPIGNCEVETSALLKDCNFPTEEFTDVALKCLPPLPWSIPEREYEVRKDVREECIFTIDPPTAKDLDDALSIKENDDGTFRVGVHIADVSYFVKPNTALDRDARKRATSVYLVQRAVPMLPPQLSEELCSLQPHQERLAFSAFFTIDKDANVLASEFTRTIIKSCAKLSYSDAKAVLEGENIADGKVEGQSRSEVESSVRDLHFLAKKLREKRVENGAMTNTKLKISFVLNAKGEPVDCESYSRSEATSLVEEFMLLANIAVARQIACGLPEQALLRRHEGPVERRIDGFVKRARKLGYEFDGSSAKKLQEGFATIKDAEAVLCLELLKRKAMQRARYFCTGMLDIAKYSHWALNTPLYTHFTSPIRRYADVLVHRMLEACISSPNPSDVKFLMDRDQVAKCAQQCNMKKQSARLAEDQSVHLYLCMLIHDLTEKYGPVVREGRVTGVLDSAFDVVIPEFGIEKRVHVDKLPVNNTVFDEHKDILSLYWTNKDVVTHLTETTDESYVNLVKSFKGQSENVSTEGLTSQHAKSAKPSKPEFEGLRNSGGHKIQDVKELTKIPVIVMSDLSKSPPVLVVSAVNPYAS